MRDVARRPVWNYGYFRQLALYAHAFERLGMGVREVLVIAADKEPLKAGWRQTEDLLHTYARCEATGHWPCYGEDARPLTLPSWAWKQL